MFATIVSHLAFRRSRLGNRPSRIEVCPPSVIPGEDPLWFRLSRWFQQPSPFDRLRGPAPINRLQAVQRDFAASMADIDTERVMQLRLRVERAVSLRELWHLRPAMFGAISLHLSQAEAERRMSQLNRHFPTRAPRSGFSPLDGAPRR